MDIATLIPTPDAIPVHWLWLQLFLTATTFLHLVAMNLMLGTGFIALLTPPGASAGGVSLRRDIGRTLPFTIAAAINLGVAPLLFLQVLYGQFFYTSTVLMAGYWLAIVAMLVAAYSAAYLFTLRYETLGQSQLYLGAAVTLFALIGFLFSNNLSLMQLPATWPTWFTSRSGWILNLRDTALIPRYLHFLASAVAVGGLGIALFYEIKKRQGDDSGEPWRRRGCNWFSYASLVNFPIGFWFLAFIPAATYDGATWSGRLFMLLLITTILAIAKAIIAALRYLVLPATLWGMTAVFCMTLARDLLRVAYLKPWFSLPDLPVQPQYTPLLVFLLIAGAVVWVVGWMLKMVCFAEETK
jgi:hypothetical protein